jgi:hypothetical protein
MGFRDWGSTAEERALAYPCDRFVENPNLVLFRAIDVAADPPVLFRWLCQLKAAPYSWDLLDNFGRRSPRMRDPANERLAVGDRIMKIFQLVDFERDRQLTAVVDKTRLFGELATTYAVRPLSDGNSRWVIKIVARVSRFSPWRTLMPAGDLFMMAKQMRTLKALAEADQR